MDKQTYLAKVEPLVENVEDWSALPAQPMVSVWMITYNHEAFIRQALEGVLMQQTSFPYEIVIGEDKSLDQTREIVQDYQKRHPDKIRLRLARENLYSQGLKPSVGVLHACRGKYIAMCEGDDYWTDPHKLQKQVEFLKAHPECVICFHDVMVVYEDPQRESHRYCSPDQKEISTLEDLLAMHFIPTCSVMYRSGLVVDLPDWYFTLPMGDWPLLVLVTQHGHIGYLSETMAAYRKHQGGLWSGAGAMSNVERNVQFYRILLSTPDLLPTEYGARQRTLAKLQWMLALCLNELGLFAETKLRLWNAVADNDLLVSDPEFALKHLLYSPNGLRPLIQIKRLLDALPTEDDTQRAFIQRAWATYHTVWFYESSARRQTRNMMYHWAQAILRKPASFRNIGMWSTAGDSLLGSKASHWLRRAFRHVVRPTTRYEVTI